MVEVAKPRRARGTISLAYAGELAMKNPQGTPSKNCPTVRTDSEVAYIISKWHLKFKATHKEGDEDGADHADQCAKGGPLVSEFVGYWSSSKDSDESSTLSSLEEGTLPFGLDDEFSIEHDTKSLLECG